MTIRSHTASAPDRQICHNNITLSACNNIKKQLIIKLCITSTLY